MTIRKTTKEIFQIEAEKAFANMFSNKNIYDYACNFFENKYEGMLRAFLGISKSWGDMEFTKNSKLLNYLNNLQLPVEDIIDKYSLDNIEFTKTDILQLKKAFKESYKEKLTDMIDDAAHVLARNDFEKIIEELELKNILDQEETE